MKLKNTLSAVGGFLSGAVNGLLGAGGGMIAVPMLAKWSGSEKSHATSVAVILPICVFSSILYLTDGRVTLGDALTCFGSTGVHHRLLASDKNQDVAPPHFLEC